MTCKDCVHYDACEEMYEAYKQDSIDWDRGFDDCGFSSCCNHFKNKADFVEVVKCKDCVCFSYYKEPIKGYIGKCEITKLLIRDDNFFCRDGVRKMAQRKEGAENG